METFLWIYVPMVVEAILCLKIFYRSSSAESPKGRHGVTFEICNSARDRQECCYPLLLPSSVFINIIKEELKNKISKPIN